MTAPPGGVLAVTESLCLGRVQHLFNPPSHPRGGFGLCCPDRLQDCQHVIGGDGVHRHGAQGSGIGLKRRFPLSLVFLISETGRKASHTTSAISPNVGMPPSRLRSSMGFRPWAIFRRALAAFSRASARGTLVALPSPISFGLRRHVNRSTHLREPVSETIK